MWSLAVNNLLIPDRVSKLGENTSFSWLIEMNYEFTVMVKKELERGKSSHPWYKMCVWRFLIFVSLIYCSSAKHAIILNYTAHIIVQYCSSHTRSSSRLLVFLSHQVIQICSIHTLCIGRPLERFRVLASSHVCGRTRGKRSSSKRPLRHKVHNTASLSHLRTMLPKSSSCPKPA